MIFYLINQSILGDFKWTLLGTALTLLALLAAQILSKPIKRVWIQAIVAGLLVGCFVWFGHEYIDQKYHALETWYVTPLGEPMILER